MGFCRQEDLQADCCLNVSLVFKLVSRATGETLREPANEQGGLAWYKARCLGARKLLWG